MAESKIDQLLSSSTEADRTRYLSILTDGTVTHTEVGQQLEVNEASVRRWRTAHNINRVETKIERPAPKVLIWDIESSPILGYVWGLYEQNVLSVVQDWKLLTVSWTWYGSSKWQAKQLCDFGSYQKGDLNDYELALFVRNLLHEADYAVAHNGNAFDVKKVNAKFAEYGITPPSPYVAIDTLTVAKRNMKMSSNRLDHLGNTLGVGRKLKHSGFELWLKCMEGQPSAWKEMKEYAIQDVRLLEAVFERLLPWIKGLNYGHFTAGFVCTNCGSNDLVRDGQFKTQASKRPAFQCRSCGTWNKAPKGIK